MEELDENDKLNLEATPEHIQSEIAAFLNDFPLVGKKYRLLDKIGEGAFSSVFKAVSLNPQNPQVVALKRIYFTSRPTRVENEIRFLLELGGKHNVVRMIEGLRYKDEITLVLEYFEHTNFKEFLRSCSIRDIQLYLRSLLESLAFIHALGIVHHDIKPSNFLYNSTIHKGSLVDFGLAQKEPPEASKPQDQITMKIQTNVTLDSLKSKSKLVELQNEANKKKKILSPNEFQESQKNLYQQQQIQQIQQQQQQQSKPMILINDHRPPLHAPRAGTRGFRAPEILWKDSHQTTAVDMWSVGVIILTLLTMRYPFFHSTDDMTALAEIYCLFGAKRLSEAALQTSNVKLIFHGASTPIEYCENWKELCFKLNPELDPDIPDSAFDLLSKCLCLSPKERIKAKDAYLHPFLRDLVDKKNK